MVWLSLYTSGWERTYSFPKSNLIFNWQHILMEGLLQAITGLDDQPDLLPQGVTSGEFLIPMGPLFWKVGDRCTATVSQACLSPEELVQIRFLGLALDFLHQHHQKKGLEISHFKQCSSNSTHWTSLLAQFSGYCERGNVFNVIHWGFRVFKPVSW